MPSHKVVGCRIEYYVQNWFRKSDIALWNTVSGLEDMSESPQTPDA